MSGPTARAADAVPRSGGGRFAPDARIANRACGSRRCGVVGEAGSRRPAPSLRPNCVSGSSRSESAPAPRRATPPHPALDARPILRWKSPSRPDGADVAAPRRSPVRGLPDEPGRGARSLEAPRGEPRRPNRSSSRRGSWPSSRRRKAPPPGVRSDCGRGREAPGTRSTGRRSPAVGLPAPELDGLPAPRPAPRGIFRRVGARYAEPSRATRSGRSSENS